MKAHKSKELTTEALVIWEGEPNAWHFKSIGVKMQPPGDLLAQFKGEELKLVKEKFLESKPTDASKNYDDADVPVAYFSLSTEGARYGATPGSEQTLTGKKCFIKYFAEIKPGTGKHAGKTFCNFRIREVEVLQSTDEIPGGE